MLAPLLYLPNFPFNIILSLWVSLPVTTWSFKPDCFDKITFGSGLLTCSINNQFISYTKAISKSFILIVPLDDSNHWLYSNRNVATGVSLFTFIPLAHWKNFGEQSILSWHGLSWHSFLAAAVATPINSADPLDGILFIDLSEQSMWTSNNFLKCMSKYIIEYINCDMAFTSHTIKGF